MRSSPLPDVLAHGSESIEEGTMATLEAEDEILDVSW